MKRRAIKILAILAFVVFGIFWVILWLPNTFEGDRFIIVSRGETFASVVDSLEKAGILRSRRTFEIAGRILDLTTKMQIGKYRFKSGMSNQEILEDVRNGHTIEMISVTIPEGLHVRRQAQILRRCVGIDSSRYVDLVENAAFIKELGIDAPTLEGFLMPNTYRVYWQSDEKDIIRKMIEGFRSVFDSAMMVRAKNRGLTVREVLTIASIVEGETRIDSERAIVAGVYYNRLQKRMLLQADPTIQYVLEGGPRLLRRSDLQIPSPYNTYLHHGLPPGPVNNPGRAAILAALYPRRHRFLFFVANGEGGHTFTRTYDDHRKAIRQYQRRREELKSIRESQ
jgi:UPF0755 protein